MRLSHNIASLNIYREYSKVLDRQSVSYERITSGYKVNKAKDNPDALAKSERLRMQIKGTQIAGRNVQDGISMLQTAGGALESINDMLIRIRELAVKAGNGTNTTEEKQIIQNEINQMIEGIDDISSSTEFNGVRLIAYDKVSDNDSPSMIEMPVGTNPDEKVSIPRYNLNSSKFLENIDVVNSENLNASLETIDKAIDTVTSVSSKYGALQNRFESNYLNLNEIGDKMQSAESGLRDVDIAEEMIEFTKNSVLMEAGTALMAQTNKFPQDVLRILENMRK